MRRRQRDGCWVLKLDSDHHGCGPFKSFSHCPSAQSLPVGSGDSHGQAGGWVASVSRAESSSLFISVRSNQRRGFDWLRPARSLGGVGMGLMLLPPPETF